MGMKSNFATCTFVLTFLYLQCYQTLKISNSFYKSIIDLRSRKFTLDSEPPLSFLIVYSLVSIINRIMKSFEQSTIERALFVGFNVLVAATISINVYITHEIIAKTLKRKYAFIELGVVYSSPYFFGKLLNLDSVLITFCIFNLVLYFLLLMPYNYNKNNLLNLGIGLGLAISTSWISLILFFIYLLIVINNIYNIAISKNRSLLFGEESLLAYALFSLVSLVIGAVVYSAIFFISIQLQSNFSNKAQGLPTNYQYALKNDIVSSDKYILDHAYVTLLNIESKSFVIYEKKFCISMKKTQEAVFKLTKVHVKPDDKINDSAIVEDDEIFLRKNDYVKIIHHKTEKYLTAAKDNKTSRKFTDIVFTDEADSTNLWQIVASEDYIIARRTVFKIKHVATGQLLSIKIKEKMANLSMEGANTTFYIEEAHNNAYYKTNHSDPRVKERIQRFPKTTIKEKFLAVNRLISNTLAGKSSNFRLVIPKSGPKTQIHQRLIVLLFDISPVFLIVNDLLGANYSTYVEINTELVIQYISWVYIAIMTMFYDMSLIYFHYFGLLISVNLFSRLIGNLFRAIVRKINYSAVKPTVNV